MAHAIKTGRNDLCPCGSGKKYKKCCETRRPGNRLSMLMLLTVGAAMVGALWLGLSSLMDDSVSSSTPGRVWSAEHGHWHDR
ncbi:MAG: SEC-C domain-containing protein [Acidobacteria bacterium]|nr:SEC-C domain-containing protein [Acidobacteriota bacterium]